MRGVVLLCCLTTLCCASEPYTLDLLPGSAVYRNNSLSSWGGNVVRDPADGVYHLYASAMTNGCNLGAWTSNSFVMHGTSTNATGPFVFRDVALPRWHHNPQALLSRDGTWLLYTIGTPGTPMEATCDHEHSLGGPDTGEFVQLHYSHSPFGPWTFLNLTHNASNPGIFDGGLTTNGDHGTNPCPVELPNGTVVVGAHDDVGFYVQVAPSWRGPYHRHSGHLFTFELGAEQYIFEDPFPVVGRARAALARLSPHVQPPAPAQDGPRRRRRVVPHQRRARGMGFAAAHRAAVHDARRRRRRHQHGVGAPRAPKAAARSGRGTGGSVHRGLPEREHRGGRSTLLHARPTRAPARCRQARARLSLGPMKTGAFSPQWHSRVSSVTPKRLDISTPLATYAPSVRKRAL